MEKKGKNLKDNYELFIKEIQAFLTLLYLLMIGIGMVFNYHKYAEFGINIFQYADIFDFLIAPFEDYKIIVFTLCSTLLTYILFKLDAFLRVKFPRFYSVAVAFKLDKKVWFDQYRIVTYVALFLSYIYMSAIVYGTISKKAIFKKEQVHIKFADNETVSGILIGKTEEIIFLVQKEKVKAIPITSLVKEIEIK